MTDSSVTKHPSHGPEMAAGALLPCPFCGNMPDITTEERWYGGMKSVIAMVKCDHYGHDLVPSMVWFKGDEDSNHTDALQARADAIAAWNTRAPAAPLTNPGSLSNADEGKNHD